MRPERAGREPAALHPAVRRSAETVAGVVCGIVAEACAPPPGRLTAPSAPSHHLLGIGALEDLQRFPREPKLLDFVLLHLAASSTGRQAWARRRSSRPSGSASGFGGSSVLAGRGKGQCGYSRVVRGGGEKHPV